MSQVTVVSCYYPLPEAKHTHEEYTQWIYQFLRYVDSPIVMFSEGPAADMLQKMRDSEKLSDKFLVIRRPFHTLKFSGPEWDAKWTDQLEKSNFRKLHNINLYKIWANKSFFVQEVIEYNPFNTEKFVWCDAGCWRDPVIAEICGPGWPMASKIEPKRIHLLAMKPIDPYLEKVKGRQWTHSEIITELPTQLILTVCGTMIAGDREAWAEFAPAFEKTLELFIRHSQFAGDDQAVLTSTALWLHASDPEHAPLFYKSPSITHFFHYGEYRMGDNWFAFQQHLSRHEFRLDLSDFQHSA